MPFLARAKDIVVLTVDEEEGGGEDDDRLVRALMWHGFPVTAERLISGPPGAVETLLKAARTRAGLLIMAVTATATLGNGCSAASRNVF